MKSIKALDEAIRRNPKDAMAWYLKAVALVALGRDTEADAAIAKFKELAGI